MSGQQPEFSFLRFLDALHKQGPVGRGEVEAWRLAVLHDPDMCLAAASEAHGTGRTALVAVTMRHWPDPDKVPPTVQKILLAAGVTVVWSRPKRGKS